MTYYIDTNIFLYTEDPESPHHLACKGILEQVATGSITGVTSVETIQEIAYFHQKHKQPRKGLRLIDDILKILPNLLSIDTATIEEFRYLLERYPMSSSRDLIHFAVCKVYGISQIITVDKDFDRFREIKRVDPLYFSKF